MALAFSHLWQSDQHSDLDVVLTLADSADQDAPKDNKQLDRFEPTAYS
jgi:hypothetical protein